MLGRACCGTSCNQPVIRRPSSSPPLRSSTGTDSEALLLSPSDLRLRESERLRWEETLVMSP
ncbi:hypothetical protein Bca4012_066088 [Brassica carinata]